MPLPKFAPMVVYGTIKSNYSQLTNGGDGLCLSFLFIDPITGLIPMKHEAFTVLYNDTTEGRWGLSEFDIRRAKNESEQVHQIFSKLRFTEGLARLWSTPTNLLVQGDSKQFDAIATKIFDVMQEVLGEIKFHKVPHGEAAPLFLNFKKSA